MPDSHSVACPLCGHGETAPGPGPTALQDIGLFMCSECGARVVHGKTMPRVVVEPYQDAAGHRWCRTRYQDPKTREDLYVVDLDPLFQASVSKNHLSLVIP